MTTDEQYVPSEYEMRHAYWLTRMLDHHAAVDAAFDRFLAHVRQEARAEGWERGHVCGYSDAQDTARNIAHGPHNPYTKTGGPR